VESWVFLLVGGLGAVGAAMTLGTVAAMVQYRRTGTLPGQGDEDGDATATDGPATMRRLVIRIVLGAVVAVVCFVILAQQGLLGGPVLG
jgi:hypothetical protein